MLRRIHQFILGMAIPVLGSARVAGGVLAATQGLSAGVYYTNVVQPEVPWSIHVVQVARTNKLHEIQTQHAHGGALGLNTLTEQIESVDAALGTPVAGINGGFYRRDKEYAGAPRGLQIVNSELLSAPAGGPSFWMDVLGDLHMAKVESRLEILWPDGMRTPLELNGERAKDGVVVYTPAAGTSTRTEGGLEMILEKNEINRWLPLRLNRHYTAQVREVRNAGNSPIPRDGMVVSLGPAIMKRFSGIKPGALLRISTDSSPRLTGAVTGLSGGPLLVQKGRAQKVKSAPDDPYELSSMLERHPRTAFGWNDDWIFLVQVDGRQNDLSVGMTLEELAAWLVKLGCSEALNLDGGGSSSLWFEGKVRNSPCDGYERTIANSLLVIQKAQNARPLTPISNNAAADPERRKESGN